jgi:predicted Zn finger-like uncharacterized protein
MLIACPTCAASYEVEPAALGEAGRSVRCAGCRTVWFAAAESELEGAWPATPQIAAASADADSGWADDPSPPLEHASEPAADAPPLVPALDGTVGVGEDIDSFAARRARRLEAMHRRRWQPNLAAIILTLFMVNAAIVGSRADIVRVLPQTASLFAAIGLPVNLRGLSFANVTSARELQEDVSVLVVEGAIANKTAASIDVPRLRLAVRNQGGGEIYIWTALPDRSTLGPGETLPFRSRLASPPAEGRDVVVRFFNRNDVASAGR